jgi:hypothetical protein
MTGPLRTFYRDAWSAALRSGQPWEHDFQCSSPERFRRLRMWARPVSVGEGLLISTAVIIDRPHTAPPHTPALGRYLDEAGILHQCCHCRRARELDSARWDWVPAFVRDPPAKISHGLCEVCLEWYYPA